MAFQIRVVPDALRQSADHIEQIINENNQIYTRIKVITSKLDESWDGAASEYMIEQLHELIQLPNKAEEEFEKGQQILQTIAQVFENIDEGEGTPTFAVRADFVMPAIVGPSGNPFLMKTLPLSSGHIRVIPDGLREAAQEAQNVIELSNEISNKINKVLSELQSSWEGRSYNKFSDNFIQLKEIYNHLANALEEFSQKVNMAANRYEEIDNLLA